MMDTLKNSSIWAKLHKKTPKSHHQQTPGLRLDLQINNPLPSVNAQKTNHTRPHPDFSAKSAFLRSLYVKKSSVCRVESLISMWSRRWKRRTHAVTWFSSPALVTWKQVWVSYWIFQAGRLIVEPSLLVAVRSARNINPTHWTYKDSEEVKRWGCFNMELNISICNISRNNSLKRPVSQQTNIIKTNAFKWKDHCIIIINNCLKFTHSIYLFEEGLTSLYFH